MPKAKANKSKKVTKAAAPKKSAGSMKKLKTKTAGYAISNRMHTALSVQAKEAGVTPKQFIDAGLKKLAGI